MFRKIATLSNLLAMLMVLFTTIVPHHHHHAMVCFVREVCSLDGCCNDEHTAHADADAEENESHCVSHEAYHHSDNLQLDGIPVLAVPVAMTPGPAPAPVRDVPGFHRIIPSSSPPPLLTWRINC